MMIRKKILKHSDDYVVRKIQDPQSGTGLSGNVGDLSDSVFVTMRSPLDSIRESANLANQFLIFILGIFGMFFGGILVWIFHEGLQNQCWNWQGFLKIWQI